MAGAFESFELCENLRKPAVLLTPLALSIESAMEFLLGREDLMMPVGLNRFAC